MKNTLNTVFSILIIIVLVAGVYFIVQTMRETAAAATAPFQGIQEANASMQTQVAQMLHPTPTIIPDPVTYINEIRALARLETIQYNMQQVVKTDDQRGGEAFGFLMATKYLIVIHGTVIAGIDMGKIQPGDMRLDGGVLYVRLPPAEVLVTALDESKVEIFPLQESLIGDPDPNLIPQALQVGKDQILSAALEDGILTQAQRNAEAYLLQFFMALGYKTVIFEH
jgi:hypothetical protein